jgi:hypothetical protein
LWRDDLELDNFPINAAMLYSAVGAILFSGLMTQWLKKYLENWRFTSLLCLGLAVGFELAAAWISQKGLSAEVAFSAVLLGILGASVATFGYEVIVNLLGLVGKGPRSDERLVSTSIVEVESAGLDVK